MMRTAQGKAAPVSVMPTDQQVDPPALPTNQSTLPKRKKPQPDDTPISRSTPTKKKDLTSSDLRMRKLRSIDTMPELRKVKSDRVTSTSTPSHSKLRKAKSQPEQVNFHVEPETIQIGNENTGSADDQNENGVAGGEGEGEGSADDQNENGVAGEEGEGELQVCEDKAITSAVANTSSLDHKRPELPGNDIEKPNADNDEEEISEDETLNEENDQESSDYVKEVMVAVDEPEPEPREKADEQRKQSPTLPIQQPKPVVIKGADVAAVASNVIRPATTTDRLYKKIASPSSTPSKSSTVSNISRPSSTVHQNYANRNPSSPSPSETHNRLQSLVDLVMWRDVSRSAFVFGIGAFVIISSSYTKDLNISFITVVSYLGLVYLAAIFLYRSIFCRGNVDIIGGEVLGEEEALWLLKLVLPYLNEFLWKLKALFSGDPATTMKLAVLLFVMARCGGSITIWKLAKLGFFGVFTVPKVCSSYYPQISALGKFWVRRFQDAWEGCAHKKAVAFAIFALVWNLSSVVARFWAAFMILVAFRYYQQHHHHQSDDIDWSKDKGGANGPRRGFGPTISQPAHPKERKTS